MMNVGSYGVGGMFNDEKMEILMNVLSINDNFLRTKIRLKVKIFRRKNEICKKKKTHN